MPTSLPFCPNTINSVFVIRTRHFVFASPVASVYIVERSLSAYFMIFPTKSVPTKQFTPKLFIPMTSVKVFPFAAEVISPSVVKSIIIAFPLNLSRLPIMLVSGWAHTCTGLEDRAGDSRGF